MYTSTFTFAPGEYDAPFHALDRRIAEIARAGADTFVAGSAVFGASRDQDPHRYDSVIAALRGELAKV